MTVKKSFPIYDFSNPFKMARVFLSHAWEDNKAADYLYKQLSHRYQLHYDRADKKELGFGIADHVLNREIFLDLDFFLFLASRHSIDKRSIARKEFDIADSMAPRCGFVLGIVRLYPFEVPINYREQIFESFNWVTRQPDALRIRESIDGKLAMQGGLRKLSGISTPTIYQGGTKNQFLLESLINPYSKGRYSLNAVLLHSEMHALIKLIRSSGDENLITDKLLEIFLSPYSQDHPIARENAAYLLSRLKIGQLEYSSELLGRCPDLESYFLARGFHIAMGFLGNTSIMDYYVDGLTKGKGVIWERHRAINRDFHNLYYGTHMGVILNLRQEIRDLSPVNLLALNVFTLGELSSDVQDIELIEQYASQLESKGVSKLILRQAINRIRSRNKDKEK